MSVLGIIKNVLPNAPQAFYDRLAVSRIPRYMMTSDIGHWQSLRSQINASTGKINSYRDIRKICLAEDKTVPSLGTLRNYLGEGGSIRVEQAKNQWREWFREFKRITVYFGEELKDMTTEKEWEGFRTEYVSFMGWS